MTTALQILIWLGIISLGLPIIITIGMIIYLIIVYTIDFYENNKYKK